VAATESWEATAWALRTDAREAVAWAATEVREIEAWPAWLMEAGIVARHFSFSEEEEEPA